MPQRQFLIPNVRRLSTNHQPEEAEQLHMDWDGLDPTTVACSIRESHTKPQLKFNSFNVSYV